MKNRWLLCLALVCAVLMSFSAPAAAEKGSLQPVDFTFKGVALGDTAAVMKEKLGEPDFDTDILVLDQTVKCYVYSSVLKVCTDPRNDKVVAVVCKDKEYRARADVTYGSTKAKLMQVYGRADRYKKDGSIYYVYRSPENEKQKLMLLMEPEHYYVESFLLTSLPLTEDELAEYEMGEFAAISGGGTDEVSGGVNDKGEWWASYGIAENAAAGIRS